LGDVVVIDVQQDENVLAGYRGSHRREIVNAQKAGLKVVVDKSCSELKDFIEIYLHSMSYLGANDYYRFDERYFQALVSARDFDVYLIFAELNGEKIAASMFIVTAGIMQYFLSGTYFEYRKFTPSKAIIAGAHELA